MTNTFYERPEDNLKVIAKLMHVVLEPDVGNEISRDRLISQHLEEYK